MPTEEIRDLARRARCVRTQRDDGASISWRIWECAGAAASVTGSSPRVAACDTVVLVHGSFGSWTHWLRNIDAWNTRMRVIAVDVPGFGDSDLQPVDASVPSIGHHLAAGWQQILAMQDSAPPTSRGVFIAGFSLGAVYAGWMARELLDASSNSSAIAGLILLAPGGLGLRKTGSPPVERIPLAFHAPERGDDRRALHRRNLASVMFANPARIDEAAVLVQEANVAAARFRGPFSDRPDLLLEALRDMTLPMLAIWGQQDAMDPDVSVRVDALCRVAPGARTVVVPDAGHWVGYEAAQLVNDQILAWINDITSI